MPRTNPLRDVAAGDARDQTINITNRRYSTVDKLVEHITRYDYGPDELNIHAMIVDVYNKLLAIPNPSVNVSYGISNESHNWVESAWLNGTDSEERFFSVTVSHSQGIPVPKNNRQKENYLDQLRFTRETLNSVKYVHPVYQEIILNIVIDFLTRLSMTHDVMINTTDNDWLCLNARRLDGSSTVTVLTRSFATASMETFVSDMRAREHGYYGQTILYN